ncbi:hypothetical protein K443DRAFT_135342 [Laccaria amethystina LaAM-08-1]|uniref:Oxysterol-binding protein n=1 Tax=Laccaria amethystina LaAM-08-1 TaxID=1095629 RepID=A0A0C9WUJ9_9AGAR|nr:hypothetical protein K443DRAFT_135342 [Laccaria amethystina LaAM-08-1]
MKDTGNTYDRPFIKLHGNVCKPYNSVLGEHFHAHWDVTPAQFPNPNPGPDSPSTIPKSRPCFVLETASVWSAISSSSKSSMSRWSSFVSKAPKSPSTAATLLEAEPDEAHIPPPPISAKVSGMTLHISPGQHKQGIIVRVMGGFGEGEQYYITHPIVSVNGILRGSFYITVGESTVISVGWGKPRQRFRMIVEYKEESWLGQAHFLMEGVIHTVHDGETDHKEWTKVKHIPHNCIVTVFDRSWKEQVRWCRVSWGSYPSIISSSTSSPNPSHTQLPTPHIPSAAASKANITVTGDSGEWATLIDMLTMEVIPKVVRPLERQLENESWRLWESITDNLVKREFGEAMREKVGIEQRQRDEAAERKRRGVEFVPQYFEKDILKGFAELMAEGWKAVQEEIEEETSTCIEGSLGVKLAAQ